MKSVFLGPVPAGSDVSCPHYGAIPCLLLQSIGNLKGPIVWIRVGLATSKLSLSANLFRHSDRVSCNFTPLGAVLEQELAPASGFLLTALSNARPTLCFRPGFL